MAKREHADDGASSPHDVAMFSPPKKPARSSASSNLILSLPSSVLLHVWSYATRLDVSDRSCANANDRLLKYSLYNVRLVCSAWNDVVKQVLQERLGHVALLDVAEAAKNRPEDAAHELVIAFPESTQLKAITDVRIIMGDTYRAENFNDSSIWSDEEQAFVTVRVERDSRLRKSIPEIDWEATLAPVAANLTRLDLSRMLIYNKHLGQVLHAAGTLCPKMKAVVLPFLENKRFRNEEVRLDNMAALSEALQRWHTANGGLRYLHVPYVGLKTDVVTQFIKDVTAYCPEIEYLDGYRSTVMEQCSLEFITCDLFYPVGLVEWIDFWKTCTKLREFDTVVLPLAGLYYTALAGLPPMEHIEALTISHSTLMYRADDAINGEVIDELLPKFPALKKLKFTFGDEQDDVYWAVGDIVDDDVLETIAKNNLMLEEFKLRTFGDVCITSDGLRNLLQLRTIKNVSIEKTGLLENKDKDFSLMWKELIEEKWTLRLTIQSSSVEDVIWCVLEVMKECTPEQLVGNHLTLSLRSSERFGYAPDELDAENCKLHTEEEVQELYNEVKRIHGNAVRVHMHITRPNDPESGERVQFDSLELSIHDPQGFRCHVERDVQIGNNCVEQEMCGESIRGEGVFVRDPEGAMEDLEMANYWKNKRIRQLRITGLMSDDEFAEGDDDEEDEDHGAIWFDDGEGDEDLDDDDEEEDDDDEDDDGEGEEEDYDE